MVKALRHGNRHELYVPNGLPILYDGVLTPNRPDRRLSVVPRFGWQLRGSGVHFVAPIGLHQL